MKSQIKQVTAPSNREKNANILLCSPFSCIIILGDYSYKVRELSINKNKIVEFADKITYRLHMEYMLNKFISFIDCFSSDWQNQTEDTQYYDCSQ